ncbi:hypothetical protein EG329_011126 [Mollisiaceae sp. DMI_Dod_QoI]|nr:hypothetical protein EG329_011126 [Helotiales sp. DMI_Dod_QoI]
MYKDSTMRYGVDLNEPRSLHCSPQDCQDPQGRQSSASSADRTFRRHPPDHAINNIRSPIKAESITPQYQTLRNQRHGRDSSPISISSTPPEPRAQFSPQRIPYKRPASPSLQSDSSNKRHRSHYSPVTLKPSRSLHRDQSGLFFDNIQHHSYHYNPDTGLSKAPVFEQRSPNGRTSQNGENDHHTSGKLRYSPNGGAYMMIPVTTTPTRSMSQFPPTQYYTPQDHHTQKYSVSRPPLSSDSSYARMNVSRIHQFEHNYHSNQDERGVYRRAQTVAPDCKRLYSEHEEDRGVLLESHPEAFAVKKPRFGLGSPIWGDSKPARGVSPFDMARQNFSSLSSQNSLPDEVEIPGHYGDSLPDTIKIAGHYAVMPGRPPGRITPDEPRRRAMTVAPVPRTPLKQRARSRSKSRPPPRQDLSRSKPKPPSIDRTKIKNVAPLIHDSRSIDVLSTPSTYRKPTVEDDTSDGTSEDFMPMNQLFRKKQRAGHMSNHNQSEKNDIATNLPFQGSIFHTSKPKQHVSMERLSTPKRNPIVPTVINLVSPDTPAKSPPSTPIRPILMKDLIGPPPKPASKRESIMSTKTKTVAKAAATNTAKKVPPKEKPQEPPQNPEAIRQKLAAQRIINREVKGAEAALDKDLFGEAVDEEPEEKEKRLETERVEAREKREKKMAELLAKEEAAKLAEMEMKRLAGEEVEKKRLAKEEEELRKKAKREADRIKQQAIETAEQNERRRLAAERIEQARAQSEAEKALLEKAKEKLDGVQADPDAIAKLKAKQEEAKRFAASLKSAKIPDGEGKDIGKKDLLKAKAVAASELPEEESLFVPAITEQERTRAKSVGPLSALEVFAHHTAKTGESAYSLEREAAERDRAAQQAAEAKARMDARYHLRAKSAKPEELPVLSAQSRPKLPKIASNPPVKQITDEGHVEDDEDLFGDQQDAPSVSQLQIDKASSKSSANTSFSSTKSAPDPYSEAARNVFNQKVKFISNEKREQLEKETKEKQAKSTVVAKRERSEQQKAKRKMYDDERARKRKRGQLLDEAKKNGIQLSEIALDTQVSAYMEKRERQLRQRTERRIQSEKIQDFAPDTLALQSRIQPFQHERQPSRESRETSVNDEEITLEQQIRKRNEKFMKDSMAATARQRGAAFNNAANKRTVADFETDSESEEDPISETILHSSSQASEHGDDEESDEDSAKDSSIEGALEAALNADRHNPPVTPPPGMSRSTLNARTTASYKSPNRSIASLYAMGQALKENKQLDADDYVKIYTVKEALSFEGLPEDYKNDEDVVKKEVGRFANMKEANDRVRKRIQKPRQRQTRSILETTDDEGLLTCVVVYDKAEEHMIAVWVEAVSKAVKDISDVDLDRLEQKLPVRTYEVWEYTTKEEVDAETGKVHIYHAKPVRHAVHSLRKMANNEACEKFCKFLKPKAARIEHLEEWQKTVKVLRQDKDISNAIDDGDAAGNPRALFYAEISGIEWMDVSSVEFRVELNEIQGPLN